MDSFQVRSPKAQPAESGWGVQPAEAFPTWLCVPWLYTEVAGIGRKRIRDRFHVVCFQPPRLGLAWRCGIIMVGRFEHPKEIQSKNELSLGNLQLVQIGTD